MKNNYFDIDDKDLAMVTIAILAVVAMLTGIKDVVLPAITALAGLAVGTK